MKNKKILEIAEKIAREAHKGQKRWGGEPYITHPEAVANNFKNEELKVVAWLHDVLEDTKVTANILMNADIPQELVVAVGHLTRVKDENYKEFILHVKENEIATKVKIADLRHNLMGLKEGSMKDKYRLALHILESSQTCSSKSINSQQTKSRKVMKSFHDGREDKTADTPRGSKGCGKVFNYSEVGRDMRICGAITQYGKVLCPECSTAKEDKNGV